MNSRRGLTLIELLVTMAILIAFTFMAIRLLQDGIQLWKVSDDSRDLDERSRAALDLLRHDLWLADGSVDSKFVVDYGDLPTPGEPNHVCRVRFVRTANRADNARLRGGFANRASMPAAPGGTSAAPGSANPGAAGTAAAPSGNAGFIEVAWAPAADPAAREPGLLLLKRAVRPVAVLADDESGKYTIFTKDYFNQPKKGFNDPANAGDVIGGVLYFGVALASQFTQSFERPRDGGGPESVWDSTRTMFSNPKATGLGKFTFTIERASVPRDRVFPRSARAQLVLAREDADRRVVRLAEEIDAKVTAMPLDDPLPLNVASGDWVKIGGEWMEVSEAAPRMLRIRARAILGSHATAHKAGTSVLSGRLFTMDVPLDIARDADTYDLR
ncbi:MAG: prepilin-type N-terminal cleavage/methylation domain-containing protein [Planctomycetes bacterium]|nr:prepilin-type N-terminal cleavage/methylation domain-containing protein [Planctomycetota bacterium]